jgi:ankyrin repeat protein
LRWAAQNGHTDIAASVIAKGADMDIQTQYGDTALRFATEKGHTDVAASLIAEGANMDIQNEDGWTVGICRIKALK